MSQLDIAKAIFGDGGAGDKVTMRYGTAQSDVSENKLDVKLDGSDEPITVSCYESINAGQRVTVYNSGGLLKAICIGSGTIGGNLFTADSAYFDKLFANEGFFNKLFADEAFIGKLTADQAFIGWLNADYASIDTLETNYATIENLNAAHAEIDELVATKANVDFLEANYAKVEKLESGEAVIRNATIDVANVNNLENHYAQIDLLNASNAWLDHGTIKDGAIGNANISNGAITDAKIADATITSGKIASINADTINAGTIKTDRLIIKDEATGEYGIVDAINTHAASIEPGVIDVTDLRSFMATIGGFEITTDAIHSSLDGANKAAIDDPTPGVYIGHTGIGIGDGSVVGAGLNVPARYDGDWVEIDESIASIADDGYIELTTDHAEFSGDVVSIFGDRGSPFEVRSDGSVKITGKNGGISLDANTGELTIDVDRMSIGSYAVVNTEDFASFTSAINDKVDSISDQMDGQIETWYLRGTPTLSNAPANEWTTAEAKANHAGDLYYDLDTATAYRFVAENGTYKWVVVDDSTARALQAAAAAQDTADGKRRVFVATPYPPYDIGDLWTNGIDLYRCKVAKTAGGAYSFNDWMLATDYQTEAKVTTKIEQNNGQIRLYVNETVENKVGDETAQRKAEIKVERDRITNEVLARQGLSAQVSQMQQSPAGFSWSVSTTQYADSVGSGAMTYAANQAQGAKDYAKGQADAAAKTATSYMDFNVTNTGALTIGNKTNGSFTGNRLVIGNGSTDIQSAAGVSLANYGSTTRVGTPTGFNTYMDAGAVYTRRGTKNLTGAWSPSAADSNALDQSRLEVYGNAGTCFLYSQKTSGGMRGMYGGGNNIISNSGANVWIGTTNSVVAPMSSGESLGNSSNKWADLYTSVLHCTGNAAISGTVYYGALSASSSIKVKENVESLAEDEAARLLDVRPVSFDYKDGYGGKDKRGVIAEEVEALMPNLVTEDENGIKGVDYTGFIAPLIKLCQMQQEQIETLEARVSELERRL